jgi:hypothetical protein
MILKHKWRPRMKKFFNVYKQDKYYIGRGGAKILIADMTVRHLENAVKLQERRGTSTNRICAITDLVNEFLIRMTTNTHTTGAGAQQMHEAALGNFLTNFGERFVELCRQYPSLSEENPMMKALRKELDNKLDESPSLSS